MPDPAAASRTVAFEGADHGGGVSLFLVDADPGRGAEPHTHPYSETFVVRDGKARFVLGDRLVDAVAGDIVVVPPDTVHGFKNVGTGRLDLVCVHAAARMETTWLPSGAEGGDAESAGVARGAAGAGRAQS